MGNTYWYVEYAKVFFAYIFVMFVYPSILFRGYLKEKSRTFRFGFCACGMLVIISSVVLMLGVLHILNIWVVRLIFYGSLIWSISRSIHMPMTPKYLFYKISNRTYGNKLIFLHIRTAVRKALEKVFHYVWNAVKHDFVEILVFCGLLLYGVLYFSWTPMHQHGYGFSDMPVHHYWTYGLQQGKIFIAGIYPEGMHCVAYTISTLFGIELYNVILFLQAANMVTFLTSVYLFAREVMGWKGSALVFLAGLLVLRVDDTTLRYMFSRLQISLPQEYGLYGVFTTPLFLIRYLKYGKRVMVKCRKTKLIWDENLLVFLLSISVTLSTHFYPTIMAFAACMGVVFVWLTKVIHWRRFFALAIASVLALVISFTPMILAFAEGIQFQGSIYWALNIINPPAVEAPEIEEAPNPDEQTDTMVNTTSGEGVTEVSPEYSQQIVREKTLKEKLSDFWVMFRIRLERNVKGIYSGGYRAFYKENWVNAFLAITKYAFILCIAYRISVLILRFFFIKWNMDPSLFDGHAIIAMCTIMVMILLSSGSTDFPTLLSKDRLGAITHIYFMMLLAVPVDLIGIIISRLIGKKIMSVLTLPAVAATIALVISNGYYHNYLYALATRYNAAVDTTYSIIDSFPKNQFTIVSTTDEMYQQIDYGYHEEAYTFVRNCKKRDYYIPTQYIFFYVEKRPIKYGNSNYSEGPSWLANSSYTDDMGHGNHVISGEISDDKADLPLIVGSKLSNAYTQLHNREIVESKMNRYLRNLIEEYPNEISVYYEDDYFICYCLEQNAARLINFGGRKA